MFKIIDETNFEFNVDDDILQISINKLGFYKIGFELKRITNTKENINLIKVLKNTSDIIWDYLNSNPKITNIIILFFESEKFDTGQWINICEKFINRYSKDILKTTRIGGSIFITR